MGINKVIKDYSPTLFVPRNTWTPVLTSTGTSPSGWTGDGTYSEWRRNGDLIIVRGLITHATNATQGTGSWKTSLPVRAKARTDYQVAGDWYYYDNGLAAFGHMLIDGLGSGYVNPTAMFGTIMYGNSTWKFLGPGGITNDYSDAGSLNFWMFYEAAW